jgi:hypothetical protein
MRVFFATVLSLLSVQGVVCGFAAEPNAFHADFAAGSGDRWEVILGLPWVARDGEFASTADPATYLKGMVVCDFGMTDGEVETVVRPAAYETRSVGLVGKYIDADRYWFLRIVWWQGSIIIKGEKQRTLFLGPFSLRGKEAKGLIEEPVHLRAVTRDGRVGVFVNGVLRCVFDDPYPGQPGRPGLYTEANSIATSFRAVRFAP